MSTIYGEHDLHYVKKNWHPRQMINMYDSTTGEFCGYFYVEELDPDNEDGDFAEPVDENGEYMKPILIGED